MVRDLEAAQATPPTVPSGSTTPLILRTAS